MSDEPRSVPMHENISMSNFYCLDCHLNFSTKGQCEIHWKATHGEEGGRGAVDGFDIALGNQLVTMQERRKEWIEEQACQFAMALHPGFTVEDFVAEAEIGDA